MDDVGGTVTEVLGKWTGEMGIGEFVRVYNYLDQNQVGIDMV